MTPTLIHYLGAIGIVVSVLVLPYLVLQVISVAYDACREWQCRRTWRSVDRHLDRIRRASKLVPLSTRDHRPRLGERVWLRHDPLDETKGGVSCKVHIVDETSGAVCSTSPDDPRIQRLS